MSTALLKMLSEKNTEKQQPDTKMECFFIEDVLSDEKDTITIEKPNLSIQDIISPILDGKSIVYHFTDKTVYFNELVLKDEGTDYKYGIYMIDRGINDLIVINLDENMDLLFGGMLYTTPKNVDVIIPMCCCPYNSVSIKYKILDNVDSKFKCKNITLNNKIHERLTHNSVKNYIGMEFKSGSIVLV